MRTVNGGEVGAAGIAVDILLETLLVAVAGGVLWKGAPFSFPTASAAGCNAAATPSSTVASYTAALLLPVRFPPVVPTVPHVFVLRAFVFLLTVLTAVS